jgi:hypothetical protein
VILTEEILILLREHSRMTGRSLQVCAAELLQKALTNNGAPPSKPALAKAELISADVLPSADQLDLFAF